MSEYPNLRRVCELIDEDNGGPIHAERFGVDTRFEERFAEAVAEWPAPSLQMWDGWVAQLDEDEKWTLAAGDESDMDAMLGRLPDGHGDALHQFFDMFFDGVEATINRSFHVG